MTEEEVLKKWFGAGGNSAGFSGCVMFGEGEDREGWSIYGDRAMLMYPSERQQRLERAPMQWEVDAITKRGKVTVGVCDQQRHDTGPFEFGASYTNGTLNKVIASLEKLRQSIPEKYRAKARCEIDSEGSYEDSHYAHIKVTYERPETDEEWALRKQHLAERIEYHREQRRQKFERLKGEFEESA